MLWKKKRKSELAVGALYPRPEGRGFMTQVIIPIHRRYIYALIWNYIESF